MKDRTFWLILAVVIQLFASITNNGGLNGAGMLIIGAIIYFGYDFVTERKGKNEH